MAIMFSSPTMIMMFICGMIFLITFFGGIITAIVQTARGKLRVDYDKLAAQYAQEDAARRKGILISKPE
jgi:hypothetical protein